MYQCILCSLSRFLCFAFFLINLPIMLALCMFYVSRSFIFCVCFTSTLALSSFKLCRYLINNNKKFKKFTWPSCSFLSFFLPTSHFLSLFSPFPSSSSYSSSSSSPPLSSLSLSLGPSIFLFFSFLHPFHLFLIIITNFLHNL